jgi:outer membrane lipoprotein-sorting protein
VDIEGLEKTEGVNEQEIIESPVNPANQKEKTNRELSYIEMTEKLWFSYPDKFRSESVNGRHDMICAESKGRFVKIIDEFIESKEKSPVDLYTDILLFRQPESLTKRLKAAGVETNLSSLKRHNDKIYFVVGVPPGEEKPSSSLWVEKDSLLPERYTIYKNGLFVDIFYKDWKKVSRTWYPLKITAFLDGILFFEAKTEKFELEADFAKDLFNVKRLISIFPESGNSDNKSGTIKNESEEIEKSITDFKKIYE